MQLTHLWGRATGFLVAMACSHLACYGCSQSASTFDVLREARPEWASAIESKSQAAELIIGDWNDHWGAYNARAFSIQGEKLLLETAVQSNGSYRWTQYGTTTNGASARALAAIQNTIEQLKPDRQNVRERDCDAFIWIRHHKSPILAQPARVELAFREVARWNEAGFSDGIVPPDRTLAGGYLAELPDVTANELAYIFAINLVTLIEIEAAAAPEL